jgi:hypothetical protein
MFCFHLRRNAMLAGSAYVAHSHARPALFVVGAATLLLLFVGIHNAWDVVTYHVLVKKREQGGLSGMGENHRNQRETYFYGWCTRTIRSKE